MDVISNKKICTEWYDDGLYFEGSTEEIEERESVQGFGGQEP